MNNNNIVIKQTNNKLSLVFIVDGVELEKTAKVTKVKDKTVVGVVFNGKEIIGTDKCKTKYNSGSPIKIIKYTLN